MRLQPADGWVRDAILDHNHRILNRKGVKKKGGIREEATEVTYLVDIGIVAVIWHFNLAMTWQQRIE